MSGIPATIVKTSVSIRTAAARGPIPTSSESTVGAPRAWLESRFSDLRQQPMQHGDTTSVSADVARHRYDFSTRPLDDATMGDSLVERRERIRCRHGRTFAPYLRTGADYRDRADVKADSTFTRANLPREIPQKSHGRGFTQHPDIRWWERLERKEPVQSQDQMDCGCPG